MKTIARHELIQHLRLQFKIDWHGYHGIAHWARVRVNGLKLSRSTGANPHVVELFAFFHDAARSNESVDDGHGMRGAKLASDLRGRFFEASDLEMDLLIEACNGHSDGGIDGDITVRTCWDADRLDLARVGIRPAAQYLCTDAARQPEFLWQAIDRSLTWRQEWETRRDDDSLTF